MKSSRVALASEILQRCIESLARGDSETISQVPTRRAKNPSENESAHSGSIKVLETEDSNAKHSEVARLDVR